MPWGLGQDELPPLLESWSPRVAMMQTQPYGFWRGPGVVLLELSKRIAFFRNIAPAIARVTTRTASP